jgi:hypothetical protein
MRKSRHDNIHETPDVSHIQNPDVQHEESDVNVKAILYFVVGLFLLMGVTLVLMHFMLNFFEEQAVKSERQPGPMALTEKERLPPEPRLQAAPGFGAEGENLELQKPQAEIEVVSQKWEALLKNGMTDEKTGVRTAIPIQDAMKALVEQNMVKSRPQENKQGMDSEVDGIPSYPSSGRMMEKRIP